MLREPAPVASSTSAGADPAAQAAWAARLRAAADDAADVAVALRRAGPDVGLRGPAGQALRHLLDTVAAEVRALATECDEIASALRRAAA